MFMLMFAAISCGLEEIGKDPDGGAGEIWTAPGSDMDSIAVGKSVAYVTAMEYFDRYDWRADPGRGEVKCSLVVYADGKPVMKIPVGEKYETSSDPETHRMLNGHIYTDYLSETETVIKRDGKELIRYAGREIICGMACRQGEIHTLGHNASGEGFTYRINGEIIMERASGSSFGSLHYEGDNISFAFREPIKSEKDTLERYYFVLDGEVLQTAVREDLKKVWDIIPYKGDVCYLASLVGVSAPVLVSPEGMQALSIAPKAKMLTARILHDDEHLYVEGLVEREGLEMTSVLWHADGRSNIFANGMTVSSSCVDGGCICCVLNPSPPYMKGVIYQNGKYHSMPEDCFSSGSRTSALIDGILHVGLSSQSGSHPVIWRDGEIIPLDINGFITSVSTNAD